MCDKSRPVKFKISEKSSAGQKEREKEREIKRTFYTESNIYNYTQAQSVKKIREDIN